jgi:hypothetical protein
MATLPAVACNAAADNEEPIEPEAPPATISAFGDPAALEGLAVYASPFNGGVEGVLGPSGWTCEYIVGARGHGLTLEIRAPGTAPGGGNGITLFSPWSPGIFGDGCGGKRPEELRFPELWLPIEECRHLETPDEITYLSDTTATFENTDGERGVIAVELSHDVIWRLGCPVSVEPPVCDAVVNDYVARVG